MIFGRTKKRHEIKQKKKQKKIEIRGSFACDLCVFFIDNKK